MDVASHDSAAAAGLTTTRPPTEGWLDAGHHERVQASADAVIGGRPQRPTGSAGTRLTRLAGFVLGGVVVVSLGNGFDAFGHIGRWWDDPITFQKFAVWTLLWQLLGLGRGLAPFGIGALPPVAGLSYWLTPGTMRLPAWPRRVPFTAGSRRGVPDVVLYGAVLALGAGLLGLPARDRSTLPLVGIVLLLAALALLGLRDRTPLTAAAPELLLPLLVGFALAGSDIVALAVVAKIALVGAWWLTAMVRAGRHFPFAVAAALTDAPWARVAGLRQRAWQRDDHDVLPGDLSRVLAHVLVGAGFVLPVLLFTARGGLPTTVAVTVAVLALVVPATALAPATSLETTAFTVVATVVVFGRWAPVGPGDLASIVPLAVAAVGIVLVVAAAARWPERTSLFSALRRRAGNGPASVWLFRRDVAGRFDVPVHEVRDDVAEVLHYRDHAQLALLPAGRVIDGLLVRAVDDLARVHARSAEFVAGAAVGWAIDGGAAADLLLLDAIQQRCGFDAGELRLVTLDPRPLPGHELRYRIADAAGGVLEEGLVDIDDAVDRVPWRDPARPAIPVEVEVSAAGDVGYHSPAEFDFITARPDRSTRTTTGPVLRPVPTGMGAAVSSAFGGHPTPAPRPAPARPAVRTEAASADAPRPRPAPVAPSAPTAATTSAPRPRPVTTPPVDVLPTPRPSAGPAPRPVTR